MNTKIIKLDLNRILYDKIIAKQGDTKSRFLLFQLLDGSIPFCLTNRSVRAYMVKPDGKEIFNDLIINNYSLGYCTLELTNQVLAVPGTVKIELMVTEEDRKLTSSVFELEVIKSINSEKSIVSTNEFTALLNGLSSLSEYDNYKNEIAAARDGEVNLLTKVKKIDEQLDNKANLLQLQASLSYIPYGVLKTIDGFTELPCKFIRSRNGIIYHNLDLNNFKRGTEIYISNSGDNSSGDGSKERPYLDMYKAIEVAESGSDTHYIIKCLSPNANKGVRMNTLTKNYCIVPENSDNKIYIHSHANGLSWTQEGNVWKASRSGVYSVYDIRYKDEFGCPIPLINKATLEECKAESGTWYTDNVTIYINTRDGLVVDDINYCVNITQGTFSPTLTKDIYLYCENIVFLSGGSSTSTTIQASVTGGVKGKFIANNCIFTGGDLRTTNANKNSALSIKNVKTTMLFDCIGAYSGEDVFNYHYSSVTQDERRKCLVIEYNCTSYEAGMFSTTRTANCSTAHEGICILRIGGLYFKATGTIVNDANGCLSVYYDCTAQDGLSSNQVYRVAFRADNDGATVKGKMFLCNCNGGGIDTYSLYTGDDMEIALQAFRGVNIAPNTSYKVVI